MRALVTGGAGYIGSVVSNHLLDEGHEVIIIDNLSTGMIDNIPKKAEFLKLDIADTKKLNKIFSKKKIDIVFHFAAFINNEESLKYPKKYFKNNFEKGKIFLENCIKNNINKFIYSSTAAVYGNKKSQVTEKEKLNPMSPYPKSKLKLEKFLMNKKTYYNKENNKVYDYDAYSKGELIHIGNLVTEKDSQGRITYKTI